MTASTVSGGAHMVPWRPEGCGPFGCDRSMAIPDKGLSIKQRICSATQTADTNLQHYGNADYGKCLTGQHIKKDPHPHC